MPKIKSKEEKNVIAKYCVSRSKGRSGAKKSVEKEGQIAERKGEVELYLRRQI